MKRAIVFLLVLLPAYAVAIDVTEPFEDPAKEARYQRLVAELRCLVCQNQTVADSNAPLAVDLREQVRSRIEAGHSDAEIIGFLTERYGAFVLYRPPLQWRTLLLWSSPLLLLALGLFIAVRFLRQGRRRAAVPDEAASRRVRALLDDGDGGAGR